MEKHEKAARPIARTLGIDGIHRTSFLVCELAGQVCPTLNYSGGHLHWLVNGGHNNISAITGIFKSAVGKFLEMGRVSRPRTVTTRDVERPTGLRFFSAVPEEVAEALRDHLDEVYVPVPKSRKRTK
jgi:hypothetical protein